MLQDRQHPRGRPLTAEIVGPAGAGKTTLAAALTRCAGRVHPIYNYRGLAQFPILAGSALSLAPLFWDQLSSRSLSWAKVRRMTRLQASHRLLRRPVAATCPLVVVDQGPIYTLAKLSNTDDNSPSSRRFVRWLRNMCGAAAATLDLLIYLDAPDEVLRARIDSRKKQHAIKQAAEGEAKDFLARYRWHYMSLVDEVEQSGHTHVLHLETAQSPPEEMAEQILSVCGIGRPEQVAI